MLSLSDSSNDYVVGWSGELYLVYFLKSCVMLATHCITKLRTFCSFSENLS